MYATTSLATTWAGVTADVGTVLVLVIASIVAGLVALLGLGFGIRHLRKYITGRKF